jgi:amino acid permease
MIDHKSKCSAFMLILVICLVIACLCIFVIPKENVLLTIIIFLSIVTLFLTLYVLYYFAKEIRRRCCNKKSEPLLDIEEQKTHDDLTNREEVLNQRISWREYPDNNA